MKPTFLPAVPTAMTTLLVGAVLVAGLALALPLLAAFAPPEAETEPGA
jgi:hypothetical protein